jgi:hypothetical protein
MPLRKPAAPLGAEAALTPATASELINATRLGHRFDCMGVYDGAPPAIQPKLTVGPVNDQYEQEADRMAAQVVNQIDTPAAQRQGRPEKEEELQRQEAPEEEELQTKPQFQRRADGSMAAPPGLESTTQGMRGSGQPLPENSRQPLERIFGVDFSKVRVHTDAWADQLNRSLQARAFTTGQDIFFRQGEHNPGMRAGQELLAHELTHVVQQNGGALPWVQNQVKKAGSVSSSNWPITIESSGSLSEFKSIQRISEKDARQRLGAADGQNEAVAVLIDLNDVRDEIPKIENALTGLTGFVGQYPKTSGFRDQQYPSQKRVRDLLELQVTRLSDNLSTFVEILESIEDWYIAAEPDERARQAKANRDVWQGLRSKFVGADKEISTLFGGKPTYTQEIAEHAGVGKIKMLREEIKAWFNMAGGFSAIGRAHEIKTEITSVDSDVDKGFPPDEHFLSGYYQGGSEGESVAEHYSVKKDLTPIPSSGPMIVIGNKVTGPPTEARNLAELLQQTEMGITPLNPGSWAENFRAIPAPRDRGDGQYANMNKTNARGYAWLNNAAGWDKTGWEWLHVRAASLGGETKGTNLVLGTRDANTLMMPFESNIRLLAGLVKEYPNILDELRVQWSVESANGHTAKTIKIAWTLIPTAHAPKRVKVMADKASGEVVAPTEDTGTNLSKSEVEFIEKELSNFRQALRDSNVADE